MTIKEPENNTDHVKMGKTKHGRDKRDKQNEGPINPHLLQTGNQLRTSHQHSSSVFHQGAGVWRKPHFIWEQSQRFSSSVTPLDPGGCSAAAFARASAAPQPPRPAPEDLGGCSSKPSHESPATQTRIIQERTDWLAHAAGERHFSSLLEVPVAAMQAASQNEARETMWVGREKGDQTPTILAEPSRAPEHV